MPNSSFEWTQVVEVERCSWANKFEDLPLSSAHDSRGPALWFTGSPNALGCATHQAMGSWQFVHQTSQAITVACGMLQIGSWLFTLAGLISCMRCVHQNCKHGTVWTQLTWLWTYSSSSHSIAMVLNIDADKMQGSKIGLGLFPSRPRSNAAFVGRFSSPYRAGPSKNETCRRLL